MLFRHNHRLVINNKLKWDDHVDYLTDKVSRRIGILRVLKFRLTRKCLKTVYITHIRSVLEYCSTIWDSCTAELSSTLEQLQRECIRIITGLTAYCRVDNLYRESGLDTLFERRRQQRLVFLYKALFLNQCPSYFRALFPAFRDDPTVRHGRHYKTFESYPVTTSETFLQSFFPRTIRDWNQLELPCREASSLSTFKKLIKPPEIILPVLLEIPRYPSILYSRLKYACSALNSHLHHANLVPSPLCSCNTGIEDLFHYLYNCPLYDHQRDLLMFELDEMGLLDLSIPVLFDMERHITDESTLFRAQASVFKYIVNTKRFSEH